MIVHQAKYIYVYMRPSINCITLFIMPRRGLTTQIRRPDTDSAANDIRAGNVQAVTPELFHCRRLIASLGQALAIQTAPEPWRAVSPSLWGTLYALSKFISVNQPRWTWSGGGSVVFRYHSGQSGTRLLAPLGLIKVLQGKKHTLPHDLLQIGQLSKHALQLLSKTSRNNSAVQKQTNKINGSDRKATCLLILAQTKYQQKPIHGRMRYAHVTCMRDIYSPHNHW